MPIVGNDGEATPWPSIRRPAHGPDSPLGGEMRHGSGVVEEWKGTNQIRAEMHSKRPG